MNFFEMVLSNFAPYEMYNGNFIRKRIFHKGYEVLGKYIETKTYIHIGNVDDIK